MALGVVLTVVTLAVVITFSIGMVYSLAIRSYQKRLDSTLGHFDALLGNFSALVHNYDMVVAERYGTETLGAQASRIKDAESVQRKLELLEGISSRVSKGLEQADKSVASRYDRNYEALRDELADIYSQMAIAKKLYNDQLVFYNHLLTGFPGRELARLFKWYRRHALVFDLPG